jgi:translation initiation factor IF-2
MAITRVYLLARELGVSSTAIMKKCQDEGLDIRNHMAVISAGLAATIREWFSEGEHKTTVETAEKVDLEKVRIKKSRGKKQAVEQPTVAEVEIQTASGAAVEPQAVAVVEPAQAALQAAPAPAEAAPLPPPPGE